MWVDGRHPARRAGPDLSTLDEVDATHAWAVGADVVVRTTDGRHWTRLPEPCTSLRSVSFRTDRDGVAIAGGTSSQDAHAVLLQTRDGGRHWRRLRSPPDVQSACFDTREVGWLGARGRIYYTRSAGRRWRLVAASVVAGHVPTGDSGIVTVRCSGRREGWAEWDSGAGAMSKSPHVAFHLRAGSVTPAYAEQFFPDRTAGTHRDSPGSYPGPFAVIGPASAVFVDRCVTCETRFRGSRSASIRFDSAPLAVASRGGGNLEPRGVVASLSDPVDVSFVGARDGWVIGTSYARPVHGSHVGAARTHDLIEHTSDAGRSWVRQLTTPS